MWHGIYQWFSRKYCQGYLNEFCFRYNHRQLKLVEKFQALFSLIISEKTIRNVGVIGSVGMEQTDKTILKIMCSKA